MTRDEFRKRLDEIGMSLSEFAKVTESALTTVSMWGRERSGRGVQPVPVWAALLVRAWRRIGGDEPWKS